jgi:transcriptional regulator with XRE-family HTH domain
MKRFQEIRAAAGLTPEELDERLIFGPGWVRRFETGEIVPSIDVLTVMLAALGSDLHELLKGINLNVSRDASLLTTARELRAERDDQGCALMVKFRYGIHDATYRLSEASLEEFDEVLRTLRDGLAQPVVIRSAKRTARNAIKTNAVSASFLKAVALWPHANPSDLWWFIVQRAYQDSFNHPATQARLDFAQSWKRTGGWALEEVLVHHYAPALERHQIKLFIVYGKEKRALLGHLVTDDRLETDKADVLLAGLTEGHWTCFGVVHVKASFAERRSDDVPMSRALDAAGYCSPLWTMDCKSVPSSAPFNKGELGPIWDGSGIDRRSAKRREIELDGFFSACFSYNSNTTPTPLTLDAAGRVIVCDFNNPHDDPFVHFIKAEWERFKTTPQARRHSGDADILS